MIIGLSTADPLLMTEPGTEMVDSINFPGDMRLWERKPPLNGPEDRAAKPNGIITIVELWNRTTESSYLSEDFLSWEFFIDCVVIPIIILFGLIGNGIVLWVLGFKIKRNKFAVYILNLAMADFLFLLSLSVILILYYLKRLVFSSKASKHASLVSLFLYLFGYNTSQYFLTAISAERSLSVLYPIWYRCQRPKHLSNVLCAVLWGLAFLLAGTEYFICIDKSYLQKYSEIQPRDCRAVSIFTYTFHSRVHFSNIKPFYQIHYTVIKLFIYSPPLLTFMVFAPIMVTSSLTLLIKVQRSSLKRQPPKLYILVVVTVALFLICSTPCRVILFIENYYEVLLSEIFISCCILLSTISSSINPFVYFYLGNHRRPRNVGFFKEILQRVFKDETES
ncbi:mas-related G-protein coupled receptor member H-like [Microcaecilia unicolor]|uniref:Mas-related G-protein coupled receptor member H-like n=1 Tax=Microcaecilia unicolor TaxID=1415580 RepID=A0A6P7XAJ3_9AMPH|nr:mas-related G-protein coupled receptor member H-like [Microcaecilia unicolor]